MHSSKRLLEFFAHRVTEIHHLLPSALRHYCPSSENPADLQIRGLTCSQYQSSSMLLNKPTKVGARTNFPLTCSGSNGIIPDQGAPTDVGFHLINSFERFSILTKLLRVTVYAHRFIRALCNSATPPRGALTALKSNKARPQWIHSCQHGKKSVV